MTDHHWMGFFDGGLQHKWGAPVDGGLWPSGRGDEIAVIRCTPEALLAALRNALIPPSSASLSLMPIEGNPVFVLCDFAGQRAISFAFDAALAPGLVSVIADLGADAGALRAELGALLGPDLPLQATEPEQTVRPEV